MLTNVFLAGGARTPLGSFNGTLCELTAPQLGSLTIRETLKRAGIAGKDLDEVIFGNVLQAGVGQNPARQAALGAGIPKEVGCTTINKVCGSSMRAVTDAARAIQCGEAGLIVAGGCESMSNAPYLLPKARRGYRLGHGQLIDAMIHDGLWDVYTNQHMGNCGEQCAVKYKISRQEQDDYAIESYRRNLKAWESGFFKDLVIPIETKGKGGSTMVERDEDVEKFRGEDKLRGLPAAFIPSGTITAGNASKINDGAASMIVLGEKHGARHGIKPAARVLGYCNVATDPDWFTIAPILAIRKLSDQLSLKLSSVDLFEINEAFSVVALVAIKELGLDHGKVNVTGGAVAIGHPIGATGARIINTLVRALKWFDKKLGIACLCIGGGEAMAIALERCE